MPTAAPTDSQLASRLRLAIARLARLLRQQTTDGSVTVSMLSALASVERLGRVTLGELAAVERVQPPSMTRIVGRLEELSLVVREVDAVDRRVARVRVTVDGARFLKRNRTLRNVFLAERMKTLTTVEVIALEQALPVLEKLLEDDG
jgi:DNA-binding MarR family transcriptional regulator